MKTKNRRDDEQLRALQTYLDEEATVEERQTDAFSVDVKERIETIRQLLGSSRQERLRRWQQRQIGAFLRRPSTKPFTTTKTVPLPDWCASALCRRVQTRFEVSYYHSLTRLIRQNEQLAQCFRHSRKRLDGIGEDLQRMLDENEAIANSLNPLRIEHDRLRQRLVDTGAPSAALDAALEQAWPDRLRLFGAHLRTVSVTTRAAKHIGTAQSHVEQALALHQRFGGGAHKSTHHPTSLGMPSWQIYSLDDDDTTTTTTTMRQSLVGPWHLLISRDLANAYTWMSQYFDRKAKALEEENTSDSPVPDNKENQS